jgi:hypothetical protein
MNFNPDPQTEERKRSAVALAKVLLAAKDHPTILRDHLRELLHALLWKTTEAECKSKNHKYETRYQSQDALKFRQKGNLRHEHVYPCVKMIDNLLAQPDRAEEILDTAIGCTVTVAEHNHLGKFDDEDGWERYRKAGIVVMDISKNPPTPVDYSN